MLWDAAATMRSAELTVGNPSGLHARPAALFVRTAAGFGARLTVRNLHRDLPAADAKSILEVLAQGIGRGQRIEVVADGPDEDEALARIVELVEGGIGEAAGAG
jgi:phosphocarrier protein HPr